MNMFRKNTINYLIVTLYLYNNYCFLANEKHLTSIYIDCKVIKREVKTDEE